MTEVRGRPADPPARPWLLYGCNGYTGRLILEQVLRAGLRPVIASMDREAVTALAAQHGLACKVFDLTCRNVIEANIAGFDLVFNAAGPYSQTAIPMLQACLSQRVHNLSLAAEIPILEELHTFDAQARERGVTVGVGLGFDVMPTDCLAAMVKERLPDASWLVIGMDGQNRMSPGSMKEFLEQVGEHPLWVRVDGRLVASAPRTRWLDYGAGRKLSSLIAWGDVASAYHSTGIGNIEVYCAVSRTDWLLTRAIASLRVLIRLRAVRRALNRCVDMLVTGPDADGRDTAVTRLVAEGGNAAGDRVCLQLTTPSAYRITGQIAAYAIGRVLERTTVDGGVLTPAQLLGSASILDLEGVSQPTVRKRAFV
jgi:short subunit dehydrogenase-like uncharacterized protein